MSFSGIVGAKSSAPTASEQAAEKAFRALQELDNGTTTALSDTQDDESPSFSPNGRLLIYATRSGGRDVLMTTTLDGKIRTRLLSSGIDVREPVWGPFGR